MYYSGCSCSSTYLQLYISGLTSATYSLKFEIGHFEIDFRMCGLYSYSVGIMLAYYVQLAEYVFVFPI